MKRLAFALGCVGFFASMPAHAEDFLYGSCKQFRQTDFLRCLSADEQIVYTNQPPSADIEARFRQAYKKRQRDRLARKLAAQKKKIVVDMLPSEAPAIALKEAVACAKEHAELKDLIARWTVLAFSEPIPGSLIREKEMDVLEHRVGERVGELCWSHP